MKKFSFIIPIYNVEKYLKECLDSILAQTYNDYEMILVDDGSTDGSSEICELYKSIYSDKIVFISKENGGLSSARNFGINNAKGKYLIFVDSDDYWDDKDALKEISKLIDATNSDLVLFPIKKKYPDGKFSLAYTNKTCSNYCESENLNNNKLKLIETNLFRACACNKIVERDIIINNNMSFLEGVLSEDMDWCGDLLLYSEKIVFYNNPIYVYRQARKGSITTGKNIKLIDDKIFMCKKGMVQASKLNDYEKNLLLNYYAYEFSVLLGISHGASKKQIEQMKYLKELLSYDLNNKVKKVAFLMKYLGFDFTRFLLCLFVKYK